MDGWVEGENGLLLQGFDWTESRKKNHRKTKLAVSNCHLHFI